MAIYGMRLQSWLACCMCIQAGHRPQQMDLYGMRFQSWLASRMCVQAGHRAQQVTVQQQRRALQQTKRCRRAHVLDITRVGQNRIFAPYLTVCMVISLLKILYVHRIYLSVYGSGQP